MQFPGPWKFVSGYCKDLIASLLDPNPVLRPSASEALQHPWIVDPEKCILKHREFLAQLAAEPEGRLFVTLAVPVARPVNTEAAEEAERRRRMAEEEEEEAHRQLAKGVGHAMVLEVERKEQISNVEAQEQRKVGPG